MLRHGVTRLIGLILPFALMAPITGCLSASDHDWTPVGEAIDRLERRAPAHDARLAGETDLADPENHTLTDDSRVTSRIVMPVELAMARRLMSSAGTFLSEVDRSAAIRHVTPAERDSLCRSLTRQAEALVGGLSIEAYRPVRSDFLGTSERNGEGQGYLTLAEMIEAVPSTSGPVDQAAGRGSVTDHDRGPLPTFKETALRDLKRIHLDLWQDTKRTFWNPTNAIILVTAGAASLAVRPELDDDIDDYYEDHHSMSDGWRQAFGFMSNPAFHFGLAGLWYLTGQQTYHTKTYEVGKTLFSALIINGLTTVTLKLCADTDSPNGEPWAWPSGHTSSAFTVASVLHQAYGPWVGIPLYGIAGLGGFSRIDDREHSLSDVVFGAALGLVVGHTVASGHRPQIFGGDLIPYADPTTGSGGIAWFKTTK